MKIVVCPDSFKGSISATQAADAIADAVSEIVPDADIIKLPLADGGEGTAKVVEEIFPVKKKITVCNPLLQEIETFYHSSPAGDKVFIESAEIIGLPLVPPKDRDPWQESSFGLGQAILLAIDNGAKEITVSLGGSATCDAGLGLLSALGFRFLDKSGNALPPIAASLPKLHIINGSPISSTFKKIKFTAICDVNNPLTGPNGAAFVFAPQKGAKTSDLPALDAALSHFASLSNNFNNSTLNFQLSTLNSPSLLIANCCNNSNIPGSGAAGGIGFALAAFFNAPLIPGIDFILRSVGFSSIISDADLIISGEGKVDKQSLMGKTLSGIIANARPLNIPVAILAGIVQEKAELLKAGVSAVFEISDPSLPPQQNMLPSVAIQNIGRCCRNILKDSIPVSNSPNVD